MRVLGRNRLASTPQTTMSYSERYKALVKELLGRELTPADAISEDRISAAERALGLRLPQSLREYYLVAGRLDELNKVHNRLDEPENIETIDGHLVFMEENQVVVLWGIKTHDLDQSDPEVWQGVNGEPIEWYSEEATVSEFLDKMFRWEMEDEEVEPESERNAA
jgi:hypothetical protein